MSEEKTNSKPEQAEKSTKVVKSAKDCFEVKNISNKTLCLTHGKIEKGATGVATRSECSALFRAIEKVGGKDAKTIPAPDAKPTRR